MNLKKIKHSFFILLLLNFVSATSIQGEQKSVTIYGQIYVDRLGILLQEAEVKVISEGKILKKAVTNQQGEYKITGLNTGKYTILANCDGFREKGMDVALYSNGYTLLNIGLNLSNNTGVVVSYKVSGVVKQPKGTPVTGASITILSALDQQVITKVLTNAQGQYEAEIDYGAQIILLVSKPGFESNIVNLFKMDVKHHSIDVTLVPL